METFCSFIDFQKAFDYVDHDFLFFKLQQIGITGNILSVIKAIYKHPVSCVRVNNRQTGWFPVLSGVHQGDSLSPLLFAIFINDLAQQIKDLQLGISLPECELLLLMYADDIVLIAPNHDNCQMLLKLSNWCSKWGMKINIKKSQTLHVRNKQRPLCNKPLYLNKDKMAYVTDYKWVLGQ